MERYSALIQSSLSTQQSTQSFCVRWLAYYCIRKVTGGTIMTCTDMLNCIQHMFQRILMCYTAKERLILFPTVRLQQPLWVYSTCAASEHTGMRCAGPSCPGSRVTPASASHSPPTLPLSVHSHLFRFPPHFPYLFPTFPIACAGLSLPAQGLPSAGLC